MRRLHPEALRTLPLDVAQPTYARAALRCGIVHLGIGAFARAHLAVATEAALHASGDLAWGISGVSLRGTATRDALGPQGALYTVAERDAARDGTPRQSLSVIGALRELLVAPQNPRAVLERIADPDTRIVSLTVTEKGYLLDGAGGLMFEHADVRHDQSHPDAPRSAVGFIVHGLALRRARALGGISLMSLDNLPNNGHLLRSQVLAFAANVNTGLREWIETRCSFPCSMVDRIVPRTTELDRARVAAALGADDAWPVVAEPYFEWTLENNFVAGRPDWGPAGVRLVSHAAPWERLKLRMVNGAHSSIAYLGAMAGWQTVDAAIAQPALRQYVLDLLRDEVEPTLPALPGLNLAQYRSQLIARVSNPALAHRTQQIAMDGSQKLPQRLLGTVRDRLAVGASIHHLALGIAAWLHYLRGYDEHGREYPIDDPLADALLALTREAHGLDDDEQRARFLIGFVPVFGDLAHNTRLAHELAGHLRSLRERGVRATLGD